MNVFTGKTGYIIWPQCPRGHISTSWFSHAALASRQWKELVDEYKGKDTK